MSQTPSRRDLIKTTGAIAVGAMFAGLSGCSESKSQGGPAPVAGGTAGAARKRALRFAHLTDTHIQPERNATAGVAACVRHMMALKDRPELVITGGDHVMDSFEQPRERTKTQWDLFTKTMKDETSLTVQPCIGNHDVWGWNKKKSGCTGSEAEFGKRWFCDLMHRERTYVRFDRGGWRFILLDSITAKGDGYIGRLDDEQFEWLTGELGATPAGLPVVIVTHIPIFGACGQVFDKDEEKDGKWEQNASLMHIDARRIMALFLKHRNVKLCLSGHLHLNEVVSYNGTTYICDGAVSGNWWKGKHYETVEGYGVIDLFDDGSFGHEYVPYGWIASDGKPT